MSEQQMKQAITQAVENRCRDITPNPFLAQRILSAMQEKGQTKMKKKLSLGFILILILLLASLSALAVSLLTGQEVVEQNAVPLALGNDTDIRPTETFSHEELVQLVESAAENGISLEEDRHIMQALQNGEGYWEQEAIMAICREAFGGLYYEWTVEERHWYNQVMVDLNYASENYTPLPGEGQMQPADARALAIDILCKEQNLPLDDKTLYRRIEDFDSDGWEFSFYPRNLTLPQCSVSFNHSGQDVQYSIRPRQWEHYTEYMLTAALNEVYGYASAMPYSWNQEAWHTFGKMLPGAERTGNWSGEYNAYLLTSYPLPDEQDMSKQQAQLSALEKAGFTQRETYAVLLEIDGRHVWKVTVSGEDESNSALIITYEMDARTGEILLEKKITDAVYLWVRHVPYAVYEKYARPMMTREEALTLAVQAISQELGGPALPLLDDTCFDISISYSLFTNDFLIRFQTKKIDYGSFTVNVDIDGFTRIYKRNKPGYDGDSIYNRFVDVYGPDNDWDQARWQQLEKTIASLEPTTFEGKLLKTTHYPAEDSVKISRKEAQDILYSSDWTSGWKGPMSFFSCVLIDARPNPIWKVYLAGNGDYTYLVELDANTGEIVHWMPYKSDSNYKLDDPFMTNTLYRYYMPAAVQAYGKIEMAGRMIAKEEEDYYHSVLDKKQYDVREDGDTVTFLPLHEGDPTYVLTFSDNYTRFTYTKTP